MNPARVKRLIAEGQIELTKKMFRRLSGQGLRLSDVVKQLQSSEWKDEDVLAYPDFTFQLGLPRKDRDRDYICVQTADGRTVRVVGYFEKTRKERTP